MVQTVAYVLQMRANLSRPVAHCCTLRTIPHACRGPISVGGKYGDNRVGILPLRIAGCASP
ncbi:MAG TPA: hypothetical protein DCO73_02620 [Alphaproteobacteria bacterium]|nr:hypothetical protein [Alphaproteobacteria bacterium]